MKDLNWRINSCIQVYQIKNYLGLKKWFHCIADILNNTIATHLSVHNIDIQFKSMMIECRIVMMTMMMMGVGQLLTSCDK